jgi:membrane dipeptidase
MEDVTKLPAITRALLERGHSEADVEKVLGANFLRVFDEVTRRARSGS